MKLSREGFVSFIGARLTPESSKSYLTYVDAFSKSVEKEGNYYFEKMERSDELKKLLQGEINQKPGFTKKSKKYQSNIKTGIRAMLKYYLFVQDNNAEQKVPEISEKMTPDEILEHYVYSYQQWLKNRVIKLDGTNFLAHLAYANSLKYAIIDSKISARDFFSYTRTFELKMFKIKLDSAKGFQNRPKEVKSDMKSSINKYILYIAEKNGEKSIRLY